MGNILVKIHSGRAYIKIVNTQDTESQDKRIVALKVELKELDKITTNRLENSSSCDKDI